MGALCGEDVPGRLARVFDVADELRAELARLNKRLSESSAELLEGRKRRDRLEAELFETLSRAGALLYDWRNSGGELSFGNEVGRSEGDGEEAALEVEAALEIEAVALEEEPDEPESSEESRAPVGQKAKATVVGRQTLFGQTDRGLLLVAELLPEIKSNLGSPPKVIESYPHVMSELGTLRRATAEEELEKWSQLPAEVQVCLASYVAARVRHLQEELQPSLAMEACGDDVSELFYRLNTHMQTYRPGFAHGLAMDHSPLSGSWREDAKSLGEKLKELAYKYYGATSEEEKKDYNPEVALNELEELLRSEPSRAELRAFVEERIKHGLSASDPRLVSMLFGHREAFSGSAFSGLRAGFAAMEQAAQPEVESEEESLMPSGWRLQERIARSRMLIIGGDRRPEAEARLRAAFQPAELSWPPIGAHKNMRIVQSFSRRIEQGSVDIVVLLTEFISHKVSQMIVDAVKSASTEVTLVYVDRGYGVEQIRRGLETFVPLSESAGAYQG